jgi:hypothetical protein
MIDSKLPFNLQMNALPQIVINTCVFISALLSQRGASFKLLERFIQFLATPNQDNLGRAHSHFHGQKIDPENRNEPGFPQVDLRSAPLLRITWDYSNSIPKGLGRAFDGENPDKFWIIRHNSRKSKMAQPRRG